MNVWFTARGAGLSALTLLTVSTCVGILASRRRGAETHYVVQYLHRTCAALGLTVLALHIATILTDSYAHVGWRGALIPFTSDYRPTAVALGSLAAYVLLFAAVLGLARGRMARSARAARVWRGLHATAYLGWAAAMLHGFTAGSDSALGWVRLLYLASLAAVVGCTGARLARRPDARFAAVRMHRLGTGAPR